MNDDKTEAWDATSRPGPWKTVSTVMFVIMLSEMMIMFFLDNPFTAAGIDRDKLQVALLDALMLGLIISPVVYFFLLLPLRRKTLLEQARLRVLRDELTGLPSRALFQDFAQHEIAVASRNADSFALLVIDPARLAEINQIFGYAFGDNIIREIGQRLKGLLRESDIKARLAGDEFGVLLPSIDAQSMNTVADKVIRGFGPPFQVDEISVSIGITIGAAVFPDHATDASMLIQRARMALSKAKNDLIPYAIFDEAFESSTRDRIRLYTAIKRAIANREFELHYQPKIELESEKFIGAEALIRWHGASPERFIPFAEQAGLISEITQWVAVASIRQVSQWRSAGLTIPVSMNISARDLLNNDLAGALGSLCKKHKIAPALITVEVTESAVMLYPERAIAVLHRLKDEGFHISIDDFGTGNASLVYLKDIPADELKIDRSFICSLGDNPKNAALVGSIVELGRNFGLQTVAEGVETAETLEQVRKSGCEIAQGYLFARPMPADQFAKWTRHWSSNR